MRNQNIISSVCVDLICAKTRTRTFKWINNSRPAGKKRVPQKIFVDKIWHTLNNRKFFIFTTKQEYYINIRDYTVDGEQMSILWWISLLYTEAIMQNIYTQGD